MQALAAAAILFAAMAPDVSDASPSGAAPLVDPFIDRDGDGRISQAEFRRFIRIRHDARDASMDGELDMRELTTRFRGRPVPYEPGAAARFIATFDLDGSGTVSFAEMDAVLVRSGLFDAADRNDDGVISASEIGGLGFGR